MIQVCKRSTHFAAVGVLTNNGQEKSRTLYEIVKCMRTWPLNITCIFFCSQISCAQPEHVANSVNHICLNYKSVTNYFKKQWVDSVINLPQNTDDEHDNRFIILKSITNKQYLRLVSLGDANCCNYFEVGYVNDYVKKKAYASRFKNFMTNNNIYLGIDKKWFLKKVKEKFIYKKENRYEIFRILNQPSKNYIVEDNYVAEYIFFKNRLILYGFGNVRWIPGRPKYLPIRYKTIRIKRS